jgi:hypothetical protein
MDVQEEVKNGVFNVCETCAPYVKVRGHWNNGFKPFWMQKLAQCELKKHLLLRLAVHLKVKRKAIHTNKIACAS